MTAGGIYTDTLVNHRGCDSIVVLDLKIHKSAYNLTQVNSCREYIWPVTGDRYLVSGVYRDTFQTLNGCDSILVLDLEILPENLLSDTVQTCESYFWPATGATLTQSGNYISTFINSHGCDSIHRLNLTVLKGSAQFDTVAVCGNYTWPANGLSYSQSGDYFFKDVNHVGCDSQIFLNLKIYPRYSFSDTQRHCSFYIWPVNGRTIEESGDYKLELKSQYGCDSSFFLNLSIDPDYLIEDTISALDRFFWPLTKTLYDQSGIYSHQEKTKDGCDSIFVLVLDIRKRGQVYIPNAFSPNGDGVNDRFVVYASPEIKLIRRLAIFDRWGELVFEQRDFPPNENIYGWDGYFKGQPAGPAVFACVVEWEDGEGDTHVLSGDATLVR